MSAKDSNLLRTFSALLRYEPHTGHFYWLRKTSNRCDITKPAGGLANGYVLIGVNGTRYGAHRLAWLFATGMWSNGEVDHKNGIRHDNRFENLRDVTGCVNRQNVRKARSHNKGTGVLGVDPLPNGKFRARLRVNGTTVHVGVFNSVSEAHEQYRITKRQLHEGCTL